MIDVFHYGSLEITTKMSVPMYIDSNRPQVDGYTSLGNWASNQAWHSVCFVLCEQAQEPVWYR